MQEEAEKREKAVEMARAERMRKIKYMTDMDDAKEVGVRTIVFAVIVTARKSGTSATEHSCTLPVSLLSGPHDTGAYCTVLPPCMSTCCDVTHEDTFGLLPLMNYVK